MSAFILLLPLLIIRYALPTFINKDSLARAAHYPPFSKNRIIFLSLYQLCTCILLIAPVFLKIQKNTQFLLIGWIIYTIGIILLIISTFNFSKPNELKMNTNGLYKYSRNSMYLGYFVYFLGCFLITNSSILFFSLILFQISCHWLILAEEKWCLDYFGKQYEDYMKKVRRYL